MYVFIYGHNRHTHSQRGLNLLCSVYRHCLMTQVWTIHAKHMKDKFYGHWKDACKFAKEKLNCLSNALYIISRFVYTVGFSKHLPQHAQRRKSE